MTTRSLPGSSLLLAVICACGPQDPLREVDTCSWTRDLAIASDAWTDVGPRVADDGVATLVAWQEAPQQTTLGGFSIGIAQPTFTVFDSVTGATLLERRTLRVDGDTADVRVVTTGAGFLLFVLHDAGMSVFALDDAGTVVGGPAQFEQAISGDGLVTDAEGATFATDNPHVPDTSHIVRVDARAAIVAETALPDDLALCTGAAAIPSSARLAFWCVDGNNAPQLVTMERDGQAMEVHGLPADRVSASARLVQSADALVAVFAWGKDVRAARLADDGSVVLGPSPIGAGDDNLDLVGGNVCMESCRGVTAAATARGVVVGYQQLPTSFASPEEERATFTLLSVSDDALESSDFDVELAHAHDVAAGASSLTLAWLERAAWALPWNNPAERIVVQHRCEAVP